MKTAKNALLHETREIRSKLTQDTRHATFSATALEHTGSGPMTSENKSYKVIKVLTVDCARNSTVGTDTKCESTIPNHCEGICMESKIKFPLTSFGICSYLLQGPVR